MDLLQLKEITGLHASDTEIKIPDVYTPVLDHIPSIHFHCNDLYSHMRKSSTTK